MIKIVDLNHTLIDAVRELGIDATCGDYFLEALKVPRSVMMTASNPMWTFGGGIDAAFKSNYPFIVNYKQLKGGGQERIGNICFCITVDEKIKASKDGVKEAISFAIRTLAKDETLILSGVGTGIGGMPVEEFIEILQELLV